jgi:uncharacterized protein (DUF433 family)
VPKPRSVRLVEPVERGIQTLAKRSGRDVSSVVNELLDEGLKMRRIPGIVFADSPSGRVARLAGTGIAVYEVVRTLRDADNDPARLREAYHWLTDQQLRSALAYAEAYPEELEARLQADEAWTPDQVWTTYPFMRPSRTDSPIHPKRGE